MIVVWSVKGGSGTTVTACSLALRPLAGPVTLVDLGGDVPATLGLARPRQPGVSEWLHSPTADERDLHRLAVPVIDDLSVIPRGDAELHGVPWHRLAEAVADEDVVIDAGTGTPPTPLIDAADHSLLVLRNCYVSLVRALACPARATGLIVISEPKRALDAKVLQSSIGVPLVAEIAFDPAVARAVDSGLLASRLPKHLTQGLRRVA